MGYVTELNTLIKLPQEFDPFSLSVGQRVVIKKDSERIVPLHIALLITDKDWNFYGYCRVNSTEVSDQTTKLEIEIISLFRPEEQALYKDKFIEAAKVTGEIK